MGIFEKYTTAINVMDPIKFTGKVEKVQGLVIESIGPHAVIGELCRISIPKENKKIWAEVVGLSDGKVQLMPYDEMDGIEIGAYVRALGEFLTVPVSEKLLGRVLNSMGKPIDGKGDIGAPERRNVFGKPPNVLQRQRIREKLTTGVRSIDGLITVGKGQRLGIFSGSGFGKSTLLGMIARNTKADVNVIALVGERGREVREFIENDLGEEGLKRSVVVVATSDESSLARIRGAFIATTIAEYFRDMRNDVIVMFDSVTRFARAQREIGLSVGEPPANRGFTPSVFSLLPKLLERCANSENGTMTGFYTVLVEGDDLDEPIADTIRGILDGHIVLSRRLVYRSHYPAVDVLASISRLQSAITGPRTKESTAFLRKMLAIYSEAEDLINVGAYVKGSSADIDQAIETMPEINNFLRQGMAEKSDLKDTMTKMGLIAGVSIPEEEMTNETVPVQT
jgi:flagellum-specific ATP synthase